MDRGSSFYIALPSRYASGSAFCRALDTRARRCIVTGFVEHTMHATVFNLFSEILSSMIGGRAAETLVDGRRGLGDGVLALSEWPGYLRGRLTGRVD